MKDALVRQYESKNASLRGRLTDLNQSTVSYRPEHDQPSPVSSYRSKRVYK